MVRLCARFGALALTFSLLWGVIVLPTTSPAFAQDDQVTVAAFVNGDAVVVFDGALNLRQTPGMAGVILSVLPDATPLTVTGDPQTVDAIEWYPVVTAAAVNGFVAGMFIMAAPGTGEFSTGDDVVVDDGPLNLRNAAGTAATILQTLPAGATASILAGPTVANGFDWYQVQPTGAPIGWVAGDFLALAPDPGGGDFSVGDDIFVFDGPLNLRNSAGLAGTILQIMPQGTTATVLAGPTAADGFDWYQIELSGGETGWAAGEFLALDDNGPIAPGTFAVDSFVFVNVAKLNLRSTASTSGAVLQTLNDGAVATVLGAPVSADGFTWYEVAVGAVEGFVAGEFLTGGFMMDADAIVADGPLNLREEATTNSPSLLALQTGDTVSVVSGPVAGGGFVWFGVEVGTESGFVAGRYLGPTP